MTAVANSGGLDADIETRAPVGSSTSTTGSATTWVLVSTERNKGLSSRSSMTLSLREQQICVGQSL